MQVKKIFGTPQKSNSYFELDSSHLMKEIKPIKAYWWDGKPNFGDLIGPWLISEITGKTIINIKNQKISYPIFTVGSIIEHIDIKYSKNIIWGSGLIQPLSSNWFIKRKLKKASIGKICAVRGKLTKNQLQSKLDWNVPNIFGDPALLLPDYYQPNITLKVKKPIICPHFEHKLFFENRIDKAIFDIIDVGENPKTVVDQIVNSSCCLSTSLHGIIVAQAYGVPWIWLRICDKDLLGKDFKFYDFFSVMKERDIPVCELKIADISLSNLLKISKQCKVLSLDINLQELKFAFPHDFID